MDNAKKLPQTKLPATVKTLTKEKKKGGKCKDFFKNYWFLLLCMALPALLMYLIYFARELHPIGDGSVLVLDLNGQYVWFFEALRNFVRGDASLLYSFSRALGGEFLGIYAYYLASPLSYLLALFPTDRMLEGLLTLFLIKTALCGGSFGFYMYKTSKQPRPVAIIVFSILYALSTYGIVQQHNTMWIDAMMWLPLISLGLESLVKHGKFKLYTGLLAVTLFSNFYIGYMVCIYCFLYFFIYYIGHSEDGLNNPNRERLHFVKSLLRMAFYSLLAVGIAMVILISAYYSLSFGKSTFSNPEWVWNIKFDILDLLYKFLPGSYDTVRPDGYPFVYCGVLTLLLLPAYFLSKKIPMRQKICSAVFVFIFVASFSLSVTDLIWHGFQRPNWLNYRYSFMLCFYMCVLACRALTEFESFSLQTVAGTGGLLALLIVFLQKYSDEAYIEPNDYTCIWFSLIMIVACLSVLGVLRTGKSREVTSVVLVAVICIEAFLNGLWSMNALDEDVVYSRYSYYNNYLSQTRPIVEQVQASDTSFYRMEKTMFRKLNDNMALNIRGLSGSTSTLNQETVMFLAKMGYASQSHWSKYLGGTPVNDSLLGIKYVIADTGFEEYNSYYDVHLSNGTYTAYRNPYALSLAYGVDADILDFQLGYLQASDEEIEKEPAKDDDQKKPSIIGTAIEKVKGFLNEKLGIDETVRNAEYTDPYYSPFERLNEMITAMLGEEETVQVFVPLKVTSTSDIGLPYPYYAEKHTCYNLGSSSSGASLSMTAEVPENGEVYFYLPTKYPRELGVSVYSTKNDKSEDRGSFGSGESLRIVSLGMQEAGDTIRLDLTVKSKDLYYLAKEPCMYYIDWDVFEDAMARLGDNQYNITDFTEDFFAGTYTAAGEHDLVMTTLAFDRGWKITVDGKEAEPVKVLGSLVGFYVDGAAGATHDIRLVYRPNTLVIGSIISVTSLGIFALLAITEPFLKKRRFLRSIVGIPQRASDEPKQEPKATAKASVRATPSKTQSSPKKRSN